MLKQPIIQAINQTEWRLVRDYIAHVGRWRITVQNGAITDGCSIPRLLWRITGHPLQGLALPAAIVHDALYRAEMLPRPECDLIFHKLLRANGVGAVKAAIMYEGVRLGGWFVWRGHTKASIAKALPFIEVEDLNAIQTVMEVAK